MIRVGAIVAAGLLAVSVLARYGDAIAVALAEIGAILVGIVIAVGGAVVGVLWLGRRILDPHGYADRPAPNPTQRNRPVTPSWRPHDDQPPRYVRAHPTVEATPAGMPCEGCGASDDTCGPFGDTLTILCGECAAAKTGGTK